MSRRPIGSITVIGYSISARIRCDTLIIDPYTDEPGHNHRREHVIHASLQLKA